VINEADLSQMTPAERRNLARMLAEMDYPHPLLDLKLDRRRRIGVLFFAISCVVLAAWIVVLIMTLRREYVATHWRLAWVGFDFVLLAVFALTGWALWRGRQIVIAGLLITATMLCCDAWFDVILDLRTDDMWPSIASAVFVELPLAFMMLNAARRLIRMSALAAVCAGGVRLPLPSLWRLPLAFLPMVGGPGLPEGEPEDTAGERGGERANTARGSHEHPLGMLCQPGGTAPEPPRRRKSQCPPASPHLPGVVPFGHGHRLHRGNRGRRRHRELRAVHGSAAARDSRKPRAAPARVRP
jgi:hypothetical protein